MIDVIHHVSYLFVELISQEDITNLAVCAPTNGELRIQEAEIDRTNRNTDKPAVILRDLEIPPVVTDCTRR